MSRQLIFCPHCEYENVVVQSFSNIFAVVCPSCGATGPTQATRDAAIDAWNRRLHRRDRIINVFGGGITTDFICGCCGHWGDALDSYKSNSVRGCSNEKSRFHFMERPANAVACTQFEVSQHYTEWRNDEKNENI